MFRYLYIRCHPVCAMSVNRGLLATTMLCGMVLASGQVGATCIPGKRFTSSLYSDGQLELELDQFVPESITAQLWQTSNSAIGGISVADSTCSSEGWLHGHGSSAYILGWLNGETYCTGLVGCPSESLSILVEGIGKEDGATYYRLLRALEEAGTFDFGAYGVATLSGYRKVPSPIVAMLDESTVSVTIAHTNLGVIERNWPRRSRGRDLAPSYSIVTHDGASFPGRNTSDWTGADSVGAPLVDETAILQCPTEPVDRYVALVATIDGEGGPDVLGRLTGPVAVLPCDPDRDGVLSTVDVCPLASDPAQTDDDADGVGNLCDNCPEAVNASQLDSDGDGRGDECDLDDDGDGIPDARDVCKLVHDPNQSDLDGDGVGDACDPDIDGDQLPNESDPCPTNATQTNLDVDGDGIPWCAGDCDDMNPDVYPSAAEICDGARNDCSHEEWPNPIEGDHDLDADGWLGCAGDCDDGNALAYPGALERCDGVDNNCDGAVDESALGTDSDRDGVRDVCDNCMIVPNPDQSDSDEDGVGDACQPVPRPAPDMPQ